MTLAIGPHKLTVAIPYLTLMDGPVQWRKIDIWLTGNGSSGGNNFGQIMDRVAQASSLNPVWRKQGWNAKTVTYDLGEGAQSQPFVNLLRVRFHLKAEPAAINRHWMPTNHGIWGVVRGVILGAKSISHDIKDSEHVHVFEPGEYAGVEVTCKPGVTGTMDCTPWTGVPPVQYSLDGGAFVPYTQFTPYYANPLPPVL